MASITTSIATSILKRVIEKRLENPNVPVSDANLNQVSQAAAAAAAPVLVHATNNEPWYKSRVNLGSWVSVLAAVSGIATDFSNGGGLELEMLGMNIAVILGAGVALWGRWIAKKPLFE